MIATKEKTARKQRKVPACLVYELMDGKPVYYRGYQEVLNERKKPEDIMGSSSLQSILIIYIITILIKALNEEEFWLLTNEPGVHLDHKNNLSGDILIYEKSRLKAEDITNRYVKMPPNIVVEVDTKADLLKQGFDMYVKNKTVKFHRFGVDKIIWILTESKQVIIAEPGKDWLMIDWNKDIEIINGITFNVGSYLKKNGIELEEKL